MECILVGKMGWFGWEAKMGMERRSCAVCFPFFACP